MQIVKIQNPFNLAQSEVFYCLKQINVAEIVAEYNISPQNLPFICFLNGEPLLRRYWNICPKMTDHLAFLCLPQGGGGGGSNPLKVVLSVAVMVAAYYTGGIAAGAYGTLAGAAAATAVSVGGSMLVNAVIPSPSSSLSSSYASSSMETSPTYSLNARGNQAKLGGVIPVLYGRHIIYPDFAAKPYTEYKNNEQYLHQLHVLTQGYCEVEQLRIDDTPISSFAEVEYEIVEPNQEVTLFNPNVVMAAEIAGQELMKDEYTGGFIVNPEDTKIDKIGVDMVMTAGLYYANDSGGLSSKTIQWKVEARTVDDSGNPLGDWFVLGSETYSAAQNKPIRLTYNYSVAMGRYEVRATRLDTKDTSARAAHAIYWESLKGYMEKPTIFGEMTLLAIKMRATNNLSSNSSRKINAIITRKVKKWNNETGWSEPVACRSIAWSIADILKAQYGGKLPDERIHLAELEQLDKVWESRGDYFDGIFDSATTIWEAVSKVARCGRALPILQSGMVRIIRDELKTIPTAMFTPRNIIKDSFSIEYVMPSEDTADSVKVQYFSNKYWKYDDVVTKLPDSTEENPANVDLFGCTDKAHAEREGYFKMPPTRIYVFSKRVTFMPETIKGNIGDSIMVIVR